MKNLMGVSGGFFTEPTEEKWREAVAAGLTEVELGLGGNQPVDRILEKAESQFEWLTGTGVRVSSVHLPFGVEWDFSLPDHSGQEGKPDRVRKDADIVTDFKLLLDWTGEKGIPIAVVHASSEPVPTDERSTRLEKAARAIRDLGQYAREKGVTLAVEDLPRTCLGNCARDLLELTDDGQSAKICFDVNHLLIESHREFFEQVAPHVVTTHLSDYDRRDERHWLPGDGCINWMELADLFEQHGYSGRFIFEINEKSSPAWDRIFTPAELVERFRKITGREKTQN